MGRIVTKTGTLTVNFSALDDDHSYYSISGTSNAYKGTGSSSSYCTIDPSRGNDAETWFYFKFDTSSIPANATITSVSCSVRNWMASGVTGANRFTSVYMTMTSGTTEKGTAIDIKSNYSNVVRTFTAGTWTLSEVQDVRVKFYAQRGTANTSTDYQMRIYGGTLTIEYSYDEEVAGPEVYLKQNGSWVQAEAVFYKTNGSWVEVESMSVKDNGAWRT